LPESDRRPLSGGERLVLIAALLLVWFLAWAHPLYPPDEGRYGSASATMAEGGSWLVPMFRGKPHLTKPPLTYWLEASGVMAFGRTTIAIRLPGLLATSAALLVLLAFARRALGTRPAVIAVALASVMPIVLIVGRLATTDALLSLGWIALLALGWSIASEDDDLRAKRVRLVVCFWLVQALAFLIKGPPALGPLIIIGAWLLLANRPRAIARFAPWFGLPLALVPIGAWLAYIAWRYPEVTQLWWDETFGRASGEKHLRSEPFWFYVPVFLAGLYPATTMMALPGVNLSLRHAWSVLRGGDVRALCVLALILPFIGFSISSGKMATYLLPLAAPMALLAAITIERWLRGTFDRATPAALGYRPPEVRRTLAIVAILVFLVEFIGAISVANTAPELWPLVIPLAIVPLGCVVMWRLWRAGALVPQQRVNGLVTAWVAFAAGWTVIFAIETRFTRPMGADRMLEVLRASTGIARPTVVTIGFIDPTIAFYNDGLFTFEDVPLASLQGRTDLTYPIVVLVDDESVAQIIEDAPDVAINLEKRFLWWRWFWRLTRVYVLNEPVPLAASANSADSKDRK
jgi:4-amino-4-deoxy-L-arabinose transferase-like glycosyltransferase